MTWLCFLEKGSDNIAQDCLKLTMSQTHSLPVPVFCLLELQYMPGHPVEVGCFNLQVYFFLAQKIYENLIEHFLNFSTFLAPLKMGYI